MNSQVINKILAKFPHPEKVKIRDPSNVEELLKKISDKGPSMLQVVSDFDMTLSRFHLDGVRCQSCYGIMEGSSLIPKEFKVKSLALSEKYYPIEIDPSMSIDDKIPFMEEWYRKSHAVWSTFNFDESLISDLVAGSRAILRDNANVFLRDCHDLKIPVLVFSGGIGNLLEEVLKKYDSYHPNMHVVSNYMEFDAADKKFIGFKAPTIHMYNKNETAIAGNSAYLVDIIGRSNAIVLGDSLGDVGMAKGIPNSDAILKIGFLNEKIEERMEAFMNNFDIVLLDDQTFDFVNLLFSEVMKL